MTSAHSVYGTAGPAFVSALIADRASALDQMRQVMDALAERLAPIGADGQVQRVARHLALIGAAGELAVALGILPWVAGEASQAIERCFSDWLRTRGSTGSTEAQDVVSHLRAIVERDGQSRFQRIGSPDPVHNRIGYLRGEPDGELTYLFLPERWKELMAGRDPARAARLLLDAGILDSGENGRLQRKERLPGNKNSQRVYVIRHAALFRDVGDDPEAETDG